MTILRISAALFPIALAPVLAILIGDGVINLGGGEKDLLWLFPWILWSVLFTVSSFVLWHRGRTLSRSCARSALVGLAGVAIVGMLLFVYGQMAV